MDKLVPAATLPRLVQAPPRSDQRPLHRQIADDLRRSITEGNLGPGERLPSEHELMRRYGVSRGTIRQARATLRADGTIAGSQGRRLAVNRPRLTQPLSELISFSAWAESLGRRPSAIVLEAGRSHADDEIADALGLDPGVEIYRVVRVRLADGVPLMIERTAFVGSLANALERIDLVNESIYAQLAVTGVSFASARHLLSAFAATRADARHLGISAGAPMLRVHRLGFSPGGEPLEWSDDRYRGDQVNFAIENSVIVSGMVRRMKNTGGM